ncbi:hypothetical protein RDI58_013506 [Solanum bulbocastanum]|uniref:Uncharacterized protein n=1 Tax=Solanum bulbocastanum TaxID=147425 RepID=A0AAN8TQG5_SOLBU
MAKHEISVNSVSLRQRRCGTIGAPRGRSKSKSKVIIAYTNKISNSKSKQTKVEEEEEKKHYVRTSLSFTCFQYFSRHTYHDQNQILLLLHSHYSPLPIFASLDEHLLPLQLIGAILALTINTSPIL